MDTVEKVLAYLTLAALATMGAAMVALAVVLNHGAHF